jgi:hypothetical protein
MPLVFSMTPVCPPPAGVVQLIFWGASSCYRRVMTRAIPAAMVVARIQPAATRK